MSDICDQADERIQRNIDVAIEQARNAPRLAAKGSCHTCGDPVEGELLFCCSDCRDDWQYFEAAEKRNGWA